MPEIGDSLLRIESLVTGYGKKEIVHGVDLSVAPGEIVALIGHNGAGKSTLLKAIFGLLPIWRGQVVLDGRKVSSPDPRQFLTAGVAYVPQGNRVFVDLSVQENLDIGVAVIHDRKRLKDQIGQVLELFPALTNRLRQRAGTLSGGEKQMLALACGLLTSPRVLLLDEPSLGLAPSLVQTALAQVKRISEAAGVTVLIVEQKVREVLRIAQRVYVLRNGLVSYAGTTESFADPAVLRTAFL